MNSLKRYLTVTQVAERRRVTRQAVLESIRRGTLTATKVGNQWLVEKNAVAAFKPHPGGYKRKRP